MDVIEDPLARRELRAAYNQLQDMLEHITSARAAMCRASCRPLVARLDTVHLSMVNIMQTIDTIAPPFEKHAALRGEVPPRPTSDTTEDAAPDGERHSNR